VASGRWVQEDHASGISTQRKREAMSQLRLLVSNAPPNILQVATMSSGCGQADHEENAQRLGADVPSDRLGPGSARSPLQRHSVVQRCLTQMHLFIALTECRRSGILPVEVQFLWTDSVCGTEVHAWPAKASLTSTSRCRNPRSH
jgi:hypothetical protein